MEEQEPEARAVPSPQELQDLMTALGLHNSALARMVAVDKGAPGRWLSGDVPVPLWLIAHLEAVRDLRALCRAGGIGPSPDELPNRLRHLGIYLTGEKKALNIDTEGKSGPTMHAMASEQHHSMSPADFRNALEALGWRQADFCRRLGCVANTASRWARGETEVPAWVVAHLSLLLEIQRLHSRFVQPHRERKARGGPD